MDYVTVKWLHILSATLLFGTGLGSAFYMYFASRTGDARVVGDGRALRRHRGLRVHGHHGGLPAGVGVLARAPRRLSDDHAAGSRGPRGSTCWPARAGCPWCGSRCACATSRGRAAARDEPLPPAYRAYLRTWTILGMPAFAALVLVFWLMVAKPA